MSPRIGSVCTGYGGLDHVVRQVFGGELAWVSDIDPGACQIIAHRMPGVPNLGDLTTTRWEDVEPVDIYLGGYPCQPFSTAGLRKGTEDERHIWPYIAESLRVLRPRVAIFENVAGHLRLGFDTVLADLARLGFDAEWCLVRASEVGAPHRRERLFIYAWTADAASTGREGADPQRGRAAGNGGSAADTPTADQGRLLSGGGAAEPAGRTEPGHRDSPAADTTDLGHERGRGARGRRDGSAHGGNAAADTDRRRLPRDQERDSGSVELGQQAPRGDDARGPGVQRGAVDWGKFAPAVARWEAVTGRPAPWATDDRSRLSPAFVEWLMGLPAGHVTDVPGLTRTQQLKALGNGVVPQQAAAAIRLLHERATADNQQAAA
ncbi:DNA cytosine methyltransferase [Streptomyces sp. NPDC003857]